MRSILRPVAVLALTSIACSPTPQQEPKAAADATTAPGASSPQAPAASSPEAAAAMSDALTAVTRDKLSDQDYMAAVSELEYANGTTDAAADLAAGRRQILGVPQS